MARSSDCKELQAALLSGNPIEARTLARTLYEAGVPVEQLLSEGVTRAMEALDARCTVEEFNLLEIMLVGRAVSVVLQELLPNGSDPPAVRGTVVLATLEGDVHDLGKNIVRRILVGKGYRVVDCGVDCPVGRILDTATREKALAIGISGLITAVIPQVRSLRRALHECGLHDTRILVGGAALKQCRAASLDVDFVATDVFEGLRYLDGLGRGGPQP